MYEFIIQGIGFLGLAFFIISYQIRTNRSLFLYRMIGCIFFCVQMCLLGAFTGAIGLFVNILRNLLLLRINEWKWIKSKLTLTGIILLLLIMTVYTWTGWISLLPFASVAITSIGYWTNNAQKIRLSQLLGSPCTLLYDILICYWGGAMSEALTLVSIIVSIFRFGWSNMGESKTKF